ncbi:DUF6567 family protein [Gracilimonas mengyeensis]|uniref:Uncharacterized protein n=1 Tax=Gracilimonas mengyeensis TaxID=1302730 RepID=A0A521D5E2_9BACT|nr:DUF6567 family protein [Gracilimonas mengyeensis]SMO66913.1 hypothetical protein SAMN06265219_107139 [Gracilimonas mengyeensis]
MKSYQLGALFLLVLLFTGCSNSGMFIASNSTEVQLNEGNYTIVAKNVTGSAESAYILGGSFSWGMATNSFGLIPLEGSKTLYKDARENLWINFEAEHEPIEGKKLALVNVQYDGATSNFILYTKAKVTITADVIEFE